jgi:hypothetical protein
MKAERKAITLSGVPTVGLSSKLSTSTKGSKNDKLPKEESKSSMSNYNSISGTVAAKKNL